MTIESLLTDAVAGKVRNVSDELVPEVYSFDLAPLLYFLTNDPKFQNDARKQKFEELFNQHEIQKVVEALHAANIRCLLFKGSALAYSAYPQWWLRPRVDTDLLISEKDRHKADSVFRKLGFQDVKKVDGDHISYQTQYFKNTPHGLQHDFDCHWKISNPHPFIDIFNFDELLERSQKLEELSPHARGLGDLDALLVSCVHRYAHHYDEIRPLWFYDMHLLAQNKDLTWWKNFVQMAKEKSIAQICGQALLEAKNWCGTTWPDQIIENCLLENTNDELTSAYLKKNLGLFERLFIEMKSLRSGKRIFCLLKGNLLPSSEYIFQKYKTKNKWLLPWLYTRRICEGFLKHAFK